MYLLLNNIRNESIILESIFLIQKRFEFINSMKILIQNEEKKNLDLSKKRGLLHSLFKLKY